MTKAEHAAAKERCDTCKWWGREELNAGECNQIDGNVKMYDWGRESWADWGRFRTEPDFCCVLWERRADDAK